MSSYDMEIPLDTFTEACNVLQVDQMSMESLPLPVGGLYDISHQRGKGKA